MSLAGELSTFLASQEPGKQYPYFTSGDLASDKAVVFIGGLYNGLGGVPYTPRLSDALKEIGWKLVQLHWTSAFDGFGTTSLATDAADLSALVAHLREKGIRTVVVMGHSTGSQDVIYYLTHLGVLAAVDGGIMQAPVSDREHFVQDPETAAWTAELPRATQLVQAGQGATLLGPEFAQAAGLRMTAYRLWSLLSPSGEDDYFSSDLPEQADGVHANPLASSFGKLGAPALALFSLADEFAHVQDVDGLLATWERVAGGRLTTRTIAGANHAVEDPAHQDVLARLVVEWLAATFPRA